MFDLFSFAAGGEGDEKRAGPRLGVLKIGAGQHGKSLPAPGIFRGQQGFMSLPRKPDVGYLFAGDLYRYYKWLADLRRSRCADYHVRCRL